MCVYVRVRACVCVCVCVRACVCACVCVCYFLSLSLSLSHHRMAIYYDDDNVMTMFERDVIHNDAYVLFYRRRSFGS